MAVFCICCQFFCKFYVSFLKFSHWLWVPVICVGMPQVSSKSNHPCRVITSYRFLKMVAMESPILCSMTSLTKEDPFLKVPTMCVWPGRGVACIAARLLGQCLCLWVAGWSLFANQISMRCRNSWLVNLQFWEYSQPYWNSSSSFGFDLFNHWHVIRVHAHTVTTHTCCTRTCTLMLQWGFGWYLGSTSYAASTFICVDLVARN